AFLLGEREAGRGVARGWEISLGSQKYREWPSWAGHEGFSLQPGIRPIPIGPDRQVCQRCVLARVKAGSTAQPSIGQPNAFVSLGDGARQHAEAKAARHTPHYSGSCWSIVC